jgi:phage gpG-like protein
MENDFREELKRMQEAILKLNKELPKRVGNIVRNQALKNFDRESFDGKKWNTRKNKEGSQRNLLVMRGVLRRSLRVTREIWGDVRVGTSVPYAKIHNEGGITFPRVTKKMRRFAWAMYKKKSGKAARFEDSVRDSEIRSWRAATDSASFWKGLALTKKTRLIIRIPKRQYMGAEPALEQEIKRYLESAFQEVFRDAQITVNLR